MFVNYSVFFVEKRNAAINIGYNCVVFNSTYFYSFVKITKSFWFSHIYFSKYCIVRRQCNAQSFFVMFHFDALWCFGEPLCVWHYPFIFERKIPDEMQCFQKLLKYSWKLMHLFWHLQTIFYWNKICGTSVSKFQ